ncbi:hypothetical protein TNCT_154271 [Trichonephila clavata]|uniref:Uncharacterized protein n=1 Tax=Trichonephila clavata TaxID=2740835 RepID=A0A8X6LIN0_TRICU|nr:hypothetical protein TNCT_154271 [Trichonephila clavata]
MHLQRERPLEEKSYPSSKRPFSVPNRLKVRITPVMRLPVLIARPLTALASPRPVSIPEPPKQIHELMTPVELPDPSVQIQLSDSLVPPMKILLPD